MTNRILVLGAGYAGLLTANRLAKLLGTAAEITLVNDREVFVERVRLHQIAAGQELVVRPLESLLAPGVRLRIGRVGEIRPDARKIRVDEEMLGYDRLVYALGSHAAAEPEHTHGIAGYDQALRLRDALPGKESIAVIGAGLTGMEIASELAECHPGLRVHLVDEFEPGHRLSPGARRHLGSAFERLGVQVHTGRKCTGVTADGPALEGSGTLPAELTVWAGGFVAPEIAASAGLPVDESGRVPVDEFLRSHDYPEITVVGDAAAVHSRGATVRMACGAGIPNAFYAANALAGTLLGKQPKPLWFRFFAQNISLGRRDGVVQFVYPDDRPHRSVLTGRVAAKWKELVTSGAMVAIRRPWLR
ncbi:NAD(P)/FAD-dependent oxidoreductase [Sciscionella marina]|uniref:NAD(P)/FAD-dependent oxidoreductase n=1 Tax=Sciscionella marina TaxID=508770 RepID=UPI0004764DC2|nr:FAD-dependent oxidoreductase [Sciscionella marina]